jgi:predicted ribosome quality control (RQC) complex YloA/Tae2 family protein
MKVALNINKTVDENATEYFEQAKKARRKIKGVLETIESFKEKQKNQEQEQEDTSTKITKINSTKKAWFEKFKWFISSEGFLIIAGRDATTNEIIIKKHTQSNDIVFHTDMAGSPFVVIKKDRSDVQKLLGDEAIKPIPKNEELESKGVQDIGIDTINQAASFTAIHSKAWKIGLGSADVFFVKPDQVTKEANSGEFMAKGSFMIRGETHYVKPIMQLAIGLVHLNKNLPYQEISQLSFPNQSS